MTPTDREPIRPIVYVIALTAATGGLLFGFDTGVISGALLFLKEDFHLSHLAQETVVSSVLVGCILGAAFSGRLTDRFGRRDVIRVAAILFAAGTLIASLAPHLAALILGRVVLGLAIGVASYAVPLYISEISPPRLRGALVSMNQLLITVGILASYLIDHTFSQYDNNWRDMFLAGLVPAVILLIGMLLLPRTPRWLVRRGRDDEARRVLNRVLGADRSEGEIASIRSAMGREEGGRLKDLWRRPARPTLLVGVGIMFVQQATGINTVIYYAPTIFEMAGFQSATEAILATVGVGAVNVTMTVVAMLVIDRIGRKPLLIGGLIGMTASLGLLGWAFASNAALGPGLKWAAVGCLLIYIASFAVSLGPIAWVLISEIYPLKVRGLGMSLATMSNWIFNFVVALTFLSLIDWVGRAGAFWTFGGVAVAGLVFCWRWTPETKGVGLEKIERDIMAGLPPRRWGRG
jgi:sugar porter (SP) family MFS transporter